jgi:hypothetical protein
MNEDICLMGTTSSGRRRNKEEVCVTSLPALQDEGISPSKYRLSFHARFVFHSIFIMFLCCSPVTHRKERVCYVVCALLYREWQRAIHVCVCVAGSELSSTREFPTRK